VVLAPPHLLGEDLVARRCAWLGPLLQDLLVVYVSEVGAPGELNGEVVAAEVERRSIGHDHPVVLSVEAERRTLGARRPGRGAFERPQQAVHAAVDGDATRVLVEPPPGHVAVVRRQQRRRPAARRAGRVRVAPV